MVEVIIPRSPVANPKSRDLSECGFYFGRPCGNESAVPTKSAERRRHSRINLSQVVRIRPFDPSLPPEYCTTVNVSQGGLYLVTSAGHYTPGLNVYITSDFQPGSPIIRTVAGAVVRVEKVKDGKCGVAIDILSPLSSAVQ
jgi:hypothetical protein